jgi:signal transduction histidine kinase
MLVAGIAHEINTPIGSIQSMHDTLFRALDKVRASLDVELPGWQERPKLKPLFAMIGDSSKVLRSGTERVTTIVKRLKSFARLDEAELKQVDIHEGIEDTLSLIGHELRGVSLVRQYGGLPRVTCYPGRLNQVFLNVLMNARQALKDGTGEIAVSTQQAEGRARIVIRDDGSGIAPEDLPRVFDPGFTTKGVGVGTGLGLSICYQIMEEHTGEIRIESELGVGTSVTIGLPIDGPKKKES